MDAPSHALAAKIIGRLINEGLLTADAAKKIQSKLAEGKLRPEDWRLPIELSGKTEGKS